MLRSMPFLIGQLGGLALVPGHAVADQLEDGAVVADGQALEAPVLAQQVLHQPGVGGGRHAVDRVERDHHAAGAGIDRGAVRRQVVLVHPHRAHVDGVVVAPAFDRAIQREVLDAGHDAVGRHRPRPPWKPLTVGLGDLGHQVGSSPKPSEVRPQRGSRAMSTIGAKVMSSESAAASLGGGARHQADGVHVPARRQPAADRKVVRWPWITS